MAFQIVVVGTSLGGLDALEVLLGGLPETFALPVAVVQHRSVMSGDALKAALQRRSRLRVREPQDKEPIVAGRVYVAPADYHLMVEGRTFALSTDAPVCFARPSIDVLFETAADAYGRQVVALVLTGASADGARGAARIQQRGGIVLVQDPKTAESPLMPQSALAATGTDRVLPLPEIAPFLVRLCC